jgi:hypothetical protein
MSAASFPKVESSYLLLARIDVQRERPWSVAGQRDPVEQWRSSTGNTGLKFSDISHWPFLSFRTATTPWAG